MMKKKFLLTLAALVLLLVTLSACAFVSYHPFEATEETLEEKRAEYLAAIESLSDIQYYDDADKPAYEVAFQDAVNELNECPTLADLEEAFRRHRAAILAIPTKLPTVIADLLDKLTSLVTLADYREAEQEAILLLQDAYREQIAAAENIPDAESLYHSFQADVAALKTDAVYYAEEVEAMKETYTADIGQYKLFVFYEKAEQKTLEDLISAFRIAVKGLTVKEEIDILYQSYLATMDAVATKNDIYLAQKNALIAKWKTDLAVYGLDEAVIKELTATMQTLPYLEEINTLAADYLLENAALSTEEMRNMAKLLMENGIVTSLYREAEQESAAAIIRKAEEKLTLAGTKDEITALVTETLADLATLATNEEKWQEEDEAFLALLEKTYGENRLAFPESLTEANDLYELAAIIDFYAFYQTSNTAFLRDTFRVKLLYDNNNPQWEINEVYWYAELLRSAVGITGYYEEDGKSLVITLTPYALATETNRKDEITIDRYDSLLQLPNSDRYQARGEDFDDFGYLSYEKTLTGIWNTQQLWYALEHEYIPVPVEGSPADLALQEAKRILREIVYEGMSDEEKIYAIFSWFGQYVTYDEDYTKYLDPDNRDLYPDELAATLKAFHIEGALFDHLAVCCSFAKTYLLFLRMEGIEAYRITLHTYTQNAIGNPYRNGYGSHALLAIRGSDGKFYYSDAEESYNTSTTYPYLVKYHQLMEPVRLHWPYEYGYTRLFPELEMSDTLSPLLTEVLTYAGQSIVIRDQAQLEAILAAFENEEGKGIQISIFTDEDTPFSVAARLRESGLQYTTFSFGGLTEYMIYR